MSKLDMEILKALLESHEPGGNYEALKIHFYTHIHPFTCYSSSHSLLSQPQCSCLFGTFRSKLNPLTRAVAEVKRRTSQ